jgi:hypothetical protein
MSGWMSYLPDGRPIRVTRTGDGRWEVECDGREAAGEDLRAAITEAADLSHLVTPLSGRDDDQLGKWIEQHASQIENEAVDDGT